MNDHGATTLEKSGGFKALQAIYSSIGARARLFQFLLILALYLAITAESAASEVTVAG